MNVLFDSVLGAPSASIDTGIGAVPSGYVAIEAFFQGRVDDPATTVTAGGCGFRFNGDGAAHYYYEGLIDVGTNPGGLGTYAGATNVQGAADSLIRVPTPGATAGAGAVCSARLFIPSYDQVVFNKCGILSAVLLDPTLVTNGRSRMAAAYWTSAAAITQLAIVDTGLGNFLAGSRLTVLGYR